MRRLRRWLRNRARIAPSGLVRAAAKVTLVGALLMALTSPAVAYYQTPGINGVASKLAGRKVEIRCLTRTEAMSDFTIALGAAAYVEGITDPLTGAWRPKNYAIFDGAICKDLKVVASGGPFDGHDGYDLVWSMIVLAHESGHMRGKSWSSSESRTQCWALQHLRSTFRMLGLPYGMHDLAYGLAMDIQRVMPVQYQVTNCRGVSK
jgi:hypothetical protein